jgi:hypothetical protein
MNGADALRAAALVMCAVLVAAALRRRGRFRGNAGMAVVWIVIIVALVLVFTRLGWR